jgi:hypothetical protein
VIVVMVGLAWLGRQRFLTDRAGDMANRTARTTNVCDFRLKPEATRR